MRAATVQRVARRAARRALASSALGLAGRGLAWGAGASLGITAGLRLMGDGAPTAISSEWPLVLAAGAGLGVAAGVVLAIVRRWSVARGALELDMRLGLRDRLSSALALGEGPGGPVAELAVRAGESAAGAIDVRRAVRIEPGRGWRVGVPLLALGVGVGLWLPPLRSAAGGGAQAGTLTPEAARAAKEDVAQLASEATAAAGDVAGDPGVTRELESLRAIERELASGQARDVSAPIRAAQAAEQIASSLESSSRENARAASEARAALAKAASRESRSPDRNPSPLADEPSLREHLEAGDVSAAAEALDELARTAPDLSPQERERWAAELADLARSLRESGEVASGLPAQGTPEGDGRPEKATGAEPEPATGSEPRPDRPASNGASPPPPPPPPATGPRPEPAANEQRPEPGTPAGPSSQESPGPTEARPSELPPVAQNPPAPSPDAASEKPEPARQRDELARSLERAAEQLRGDTPEKRQPPPDREPAKPDASRQPGQPPSASNSGTPQKPGQDQRNSPEGDGQRPDATRRDQPGGERNKPEEKSQGKPQEPGQASRDEGTSSPSTQPSTQPGKQPGSSQQQVRPEASGQEPSRAPDQPGQRTQPERAPGNAGESAPQPDPKGSGGSEQRPAQQSPTPATPQPAPGQGPLPTGQPSANPTQPGNEPRQQQPGAQNQPQGQPTGSQEAPAAKPSDPSSGTRGDPGRGQSAPQPGALSDGANPRSGQGDQGSKAPSPGGESPQPSPSKTPQGSPSDGARSPESSGAKPNSDAPPTPTRGVPETGQQPQPGQEGPTGGELPELPQSDDAIKDLAKRLADVAEQSKNSQRQAADAKKLRERAERLLKNASPQEREQLERLAREFQKELDARGGGGGEAPPPGDGTPLAQDPRSGRGPMSVPRRPSGPSATQTVDARPNQQGRDRRPERGQRVIAEWLGEGSRGQGEPGAFEGAVREAADGVERAIEQQNVPPGYQDLVRRVFQRYTESARPGAATPAGSTAPATPPPGAAPPPPPRP